jgi:predicted RNA-binding Zn-ribbon protein involved in translation (DUF1610 family)
MMMDFWMILVVIIFSALIFISITYLVWRFLWPYLQQKLRYRKIEITTNEIPNTSLKVQKKEKVKTIKCPECGQRTIVDTTLSCRWCKTPLVGKPYRERQQKVEKLKEPKPLKEKPTVIRMPFALGCISWLAIIVLVILLLGGVSYGLLMTEALDDLLGDNDIYLEIKAIVNPPEPNVVSKNARVRGLGEDYTIVIESRVTNDGGSGDVIVFFQLVTRDQSLTKNTTVHLKSGETKIVVKDFPEVSTPWLQVFLKGLFGDLGGAVRELTHPDIDYTVSAYSTR